ncbi:plasmid replication protein, CyRepA1 family [Methylobacterium haplocladii]|uniref:plasmid replication protein, CyRepA1 family n=1 Tax=Methylobacterium haplocladii TaxID=1176176 RepID=UPI001EDFDA41|nr:plasmid replication protein, CyRepA1 family [Methylobacterium haplocladii]GJD82457.1 hypothetical protein HPGCJGGD_0313 [Methylobacterium haplocladii]
MSATVESLKVAFNPSLIDKNTSGDPRLFVEGFANVEITPYEFAEGIKLGWAYCAQLNGCRRTDNFKACNVASVDIDHGLTIEAALAHPLVSQNASFIYTTASHSADRARFRVVFFLPRIITKAKEMRRITAGLTHMIGGDLSATDPTRISFGNRAAEFHWINRALTAELIAELSVDGTTRDGPDVRGRQIRSRRSLIAIDCDQLLRLADGRELNLQAVPVRSPVHCPVHDDACASAFVVANRNGMQGVHCSTCSKTYWPDQRAPDPYDFNGFLRTARSVAKRDKHVPALDQEKGWDELLVAKPATSRIHVVKGSPTPQILQPGITFAMSPKGTGKTEHLIQHARPALKTLLIGHRRSLIRGSCKRLNLRCYLDRPTNRHENTGEAAEYFNRDRYGICLDSLEQIPPNYGYDLIILDESEQVLAHLVSDTITSRGNESRIFIVLRELIRRAKYVIALDADMSFTTFETLSRMAHHTERDEQVWTKQGWTSPKTRKRPKTVHVWVNDVAGPGQKHIDVFETQDHLRADLMSSIDAGKRCFVASNNKRLITETTAAIRDRYGNTRKVVSVTSETITLAEVQEFVDNAKERADLYDVILCSPSLGTGVDITFPNNAERIDCVYGFFEHSITTHLDMDQQLHRVRHPGAIKVWISPRTFRFETHPDVVQSDLLRAGLHRDLLAGFESDGRPRYLMDDPLIRMASLVVANRRASLNALRSNFIRHKEQQGCTITYVNKDAALSVDGHAIDQRGRYLSEEALMASIMGAAVMTRPNFDRLRQLIEAGTVVAENQFWAFERTRLELFYRAPATPEVIRLDDRGHHRQRVSRFAAVITQQFTSVPADPMQPLDGNLRFIRKQDRDVPNIILRLLHLTPVWNTCNPLRTDGPHKSVTDMISGTFDTSIIFDADDLSNFAKFMVENKGAIENVLYHHVRSDIRNKPTQQLGLILRTMGLSLRKVGSVKVAGRKIYRYQLDEDDLARIQSVVQRRTEQKGWAFMVACYGAHMDPEATNTSSERPYDDFTENENEIAQVIEFLRGQRGDNKRDDRFLSTKIAPLSPTSGSIGSTRARTGNKGAGPSDRASRSRALLSSDPKYKCCITEEPCPRRNEKNSKSG